MKIDRTFEIERVASTDITRPQLCEAHYDLEKSRLVATNGHAMAVVPVVADAGDHGGWVSPEALKAARKAAPKKVGEAQILANGALAIPGGPTYTRRADQDAPAFPPYEQVIPSYRAGSDGTVSVALNVALLHDLARAIGAAGPEKGNMHVVLTFPPAEMGKGMLEPIVVQRLDRGAALGVLMPVRFVP